MSETASPVQRLGVSSEAFEASAVIRRPTNLVLTFGVFELDTLTCELRKEGRLIHLRLQPVRVLRLLLERSGGLVTRREITSALWPDDVDIDVEQGLNHCMKEIRAALGDRPESPLFIQTLPRRGYRFLVEVHGAREERPKGKEMEVESVTTAMAPSENNETIAEVDDETGLTDGRFE